MNYHFQFKQNILNAIAKHNIDYLDVAIQDERFDCSQKLEDSYFTELLFSSSLSAPDVRTLLIKHPLLIEGEPMLAASGVMFSRHRKDLCEVVKSIGLELNVNFPLMGNPPSCGS